MDKQSQECLQRVRGKSMSSHTGHLKVGVTTVLQHEPKVIPISLQDLDGMKLIQNSLLVSPDYCFTRGFQEPEEVDKEDLRLYGGDVCGVVSVVTDGFTHGVMVAPVPGKNEPCEVLSRAIDPVHHREELQHLHSEGRWRACYETAVGGHPGGPSEVGVQNNVGVQWAW